jgi:hypothetical protein
MRTRPNLTLLIRIKNKFVNKKPVQIIKIYQKLYFIIILNEITYASKEQNIVTKKRIHL